MYSSVADYLYLCHPRVRVQGPGQVLALVYAGQGVVLVDVEAPQRWQALGRLSLDDLRKALAMFERAEWAEMDKEGEREEVQR